MSKNNNYVDVIDINDNIIKLQRNTDLYVVDEKTKNNYSSRYMFYETFKTLDNYLLTGYEEVNINEFDINQLEETDFNGRFVYKVTLSNGSILNHYYTFIGFENKDNLKLVPVKIPVKNRYTIDPTLINNYNWYYQELNKKDIEYKTLLDVLKDE